MHHLYWNAQVVSTTKHYRKKFEATGGNVTLYDFDNLQKKTFQRILLVQKSFWQYRIFSDFNGRYKITTLSDTNVKFGVFQMKIELEFWNTMQENTLQTWYSFGKWHSYMSSASPHHDYCRVLHFKSVIDTRFHLNSHNIPPVS